MQFRQNIIKRYENKLKDKQNKLQREVSDRLLVVGTREKSRHGVPETAVSVRLTEWMIRGE